MNDEILVTAYCLTYNHEKYIQKALDGFVMQKTNFKYKVIVHDDASTDNTRSIILQYKKKYPEIFITIFQDTNQYSQNVKIFNKFILPKIKSKYIAVCEGDDYWFDENKLQMQVDYMEKNLDCSMCGHNTLYIKEDGTLTEKKFSDLNIEKDFTTKEVILGDGIGVFHTSSFLYKYSDIIKRTNDFSINGVGDYPTKIFLSLKGYLHYFPNVCSAYRLSAVNSWTMRTFKNRETFNKHMDSMVHGLERINVVTNYKFNDEFEYIISKYILRKEIKNGKLFNIIFEKKLLNVFLKSYSLKQKIVMIISCFYHMLFWKKK